MSIAKCKHSDNNLVKISGSYNCKEELEKTIAGAFQPLESNHSAIRGGYSFYKGESRISHY
jgi:hypothetical protein